MYVMHDANMSINNKKKIKAREDNLILQNRIPFETNDISLSIKTRNNLLKIHESYEKTKIFIHVGKCGGKAIRNDMKEMGYKVAHVNSDIVNLYNKWSICEYVAILRNPVDRFISAYNWEKKHTDSKYSYWERKVNKWSKFYEKYPTLNSLAKDMIDLNLFEKLELSGIQPQEHLYKDINYYLGKLMIKRGRIMNQINLSIITDGFLNEGYKKIAERNSYPYIEPPVVRNELIQSNDYDTNLDPKYIPIIEKFYAKDYEIIETLYKYNKIDKDQYDDLMTSKLIQN
jgi:hypothetical protein